MSRTTRWKDVRKCGIRTLVPLGVSLSLSPCALAEARSSGWEQDFIGVPVARALGLTGKGVDVGVIDGGFLPQHPAFAGQAITRWPTEWPSTARKRSPILPAALRSR